MIGCVVHLSCVAPAPGSVRHVNGDGLIIGAPHGHAAGTSSTDAADRIDRAAAPRVQTVAALLQPAGFKVTVSERIQRDIWFKLWGNMTMNPISALTCATADRILDDPLVRGFVSAVMLEAQQIGRAIGIPIEQTPEQRHAVTRKLGAFKTSMLADLEVGRALEIDALVGAVYDIGRHLGLATPHIDALFGLVRLMAQQRGLYPSTSCPASPARAASSRTGRATRGESARLVGPNRLALLIHHVDDGLPLQCGAVRQRQRQQLEHGRPFTPQAMHGHRLANTFSVGRHIAIQRADEPAAVGVINGHAPHQADAFGR